MKKYIFYLIFISKSPKFLSPNVNMFSAKLIFIPAFTAG